jgi:crotonobetainyl-CoA:carnitine CoA-transferase CaiB-like acyl-CoA transferase
LAKDADILIEDLPPGGMKALSLDYDALSVINPQLILASITPFGQEGPYKDYRCHTLNLHHVSGHSTQFFLARIHEPGRDPVPPGGYVGEYDSGLNTAIAIVAALFGRDLTGEGQYIDISKQETLIGLERVDISRFADGSEVPTRITRQIGGMLNCKDGFAMVVLPQDHQWTGLVHAMGDPEWAQREEYATEMGRSNTRRRYRKGVEWAALTAKRNCTIWHRPVSLCTGRSKRGMTAVYSGFFVEIEHPIAGKFAYPTAAYKFSETPLQARLSAPTLGQHNEEVFCGRLGYSRGELARLAACGIV